MSKKILKSVLLSATLAAALAATAPGARSDDQVDVESIKSKYWARGDESELGVVQNRLYTKEKKLEFSVIDGIISSDPFLSTNSVGLSAGYHINEIWGVHLMGWKSFATGSSALTTFEQVSGATANTNPTSWYLGSEVGASLLYAKLSVLGKKIIYYDLHFLGGLGVTGTESGNNFTQSVGIGQQIWFSRNIAVRLDYRLMHYNEDILEKVRPSILGQVVDNRSNWTNAITVGASFLLGKEEQ